MTTPNETHLRAAKELAALKETRKEDKIAFDLLRDQRGALERSNAELCAALELTNQVFARTNVSQPDLLGDDEHEAWSNNTQALANAKKLAP